MASGYRVNRRRPRPLIVLYARHFCEKCDNRVFPGDKLEERTLAPGRDILLKSANAARSRRDPDDPARTAWCWVCNGWTTTYRETLDDLERRYARRRGVEVRPEQQRRARIIPMRRRRSA